LVKVEIGASLAALVLVVFAVHAPGARTDFSYDDFDFVVNNQSIRSPAAAWASFAQPFPPHLPDRGTYRPVVNLSYAIDHQLWPLDARGFHQVNVALYAVVAGLVYALARFHDPSPGFAFAVAAVFAAHPVHCEAVDSVTGRSELLAAAFALISILAFARAAQRAAARRPAAGLVAVSAAAYGLCAFSKEVGTVVPGVLAVYFVCYGRRPDERAASWVRRGALLLAPFAAVGLAYLAARRNALGWLSPAHSMLEAKGLAFRIHTIGMSWLQYVRQLVAPATLHVDYYWDQFFQDPRRTLPWAAAGVALLGGTLAALAVAIRQLFRAREPGSAAIALCGLSFVLVFLFPVMHVLPTLGWMSERYLFLPSIGFSLLVGLAAREALRRFAPSARAQIAAGSALLCLAVVAGGWRSHQRAAEWRDEVLLWQVEDAARPNDSRVLTNLAQAYARRARFPEAWDALQRARRADPKIPALDRLLDALEPLLRASLGKG
jgi:tetratricopeptide (TPR) repeat protein